MHRLLAAGLTCVFAAALAVGAALGGVAALNVTPARPHVPLALSGSSPSEAPDTSPSRSRSGSPSGAPSVAVTEP